MQDPKQLLLMHVEKVVLGVMALLLILVLGVYKPWDVQVPQEAKAYNLLKTGMEEMRSQDPRSDLKQALVVRPYSQEIKDLYDSPWQNDSPPVVLPQRQLIFGRAKKGTIVSPKAPDAPPVVAAQKVIARAERGQAVIVFQIDDELERRALAGTAQPDYQGGLEYDHIEIYRVDRSGHTKPVLITPENWRPSNLPARYGGVPGLDLGPRSLFGEPVYVYAQMAGPDQRREEEMRKRMEEEMRKRMDEEMKKRMEMDKKDAEERARHDEEMRKGGGQGPTPGPGPAPNPTPVPPTWTKPVKTTVKPGEVPPGWYYFVDERIDPDVKYEYNVVIVCRNPVYSKYRESAEKVAELVKSDAATTPPTNDVQVSSYKKWYFQGGSNANQMEVGVFKVRCFVGGRGAFSPEEIKQIVLELSTGAKAAPAKKSTEPEGEWVEQSFNVRPGEEIGGRVSILVAGEKEKREVDFATGCVVVAIQNDVQVSEDRRTVTVPGTLTKEERVTRLVIPKLRLDYMDKKGALRTKWVEPVPPLSKTKEDKEK